MANLIIILILVTIISLASGYIIREKKRGVRCIGCPDGGSCSSCSGCNGGCACSR